MTSCEKENPEPPIQPMYGVQTCNYMKIKQDQQSVQVSGNGIYKEDLPDLNQI